MSNRTTWLVGEPLQEIPLRPVPSPRNPRALSAAASQLAGLFGPFHHFLFQARSLFFNSQHVRYDGDVISELFCGFYEFLRSPEEVITAMKICAVLARRGINDFPFHQLVVQIFPSMYDAPNGLVPMPEPDEHSIGDHVVQLLGFEDKHLLFINNWGPEWGVNGEGRFSVDYLRHFQREAWSVRPLAGPEPETVVTGAGPAFGSEQCRRLLEHSWNKSENSPFFMLNHGDRLDVVGRWLIGIGDGSTWLQCVAILREIEGDPIIVGWMNIRGMPDSATVEEFFVWPPYRKRGIGTALAGQAMLHTATAGWQKCRWIWQESEADAVVRQRSKIKPQLPGWLKVLLSQVDNSVRPEDMQQSFFPLLKDLAELQAPDGVRLVQERTDSRVIDVIVNDADRPAYGVVI